MKTVLFAKHISVFCRTGDAMMIRFATRGAEQGWLQWRPWSAGELEKREEVEKLKEKVYKKKKMMMMVMVMVMMMLR